MKPKTMLAFFIPEPNRSIYKGIGKESVELYNGSKPLTMDPHITLKIPFQMHPEELAKIFDGFSFQPFEVLRSQFYRFGDTVVYDGLIKSQDWIKLANKINSTLEKSNIRLKIADIDRIPHITVAKSKGKGIKNLPAYPMLQRLNAKHFPFKPIKVKKFAVCEKTDKGWRSYADITLGG